MTKLVEFQLKNGSNILIEVKTTEETGMHRVGISTEKVIEKAKQTFESALDGVKQSAITIVNKFRDLAELPDEIKVEFGMKINLEGKAFIAAASTESNFQITLTWKKS